MKKKNGYIDVFSFCSYCDHKDLNSRRCKAYPDGIPDEILNGEIDHTEPYKGDNGIQFEPIENK